MSWYVGHSFRTLLAVYKAGEGDGSNNCNIYAIDALNCGFEVSDATAIELQQLQSKEQLDFDLDVDSRMGLEIDKLQKYVGPLGHAGIVYICRTRVGKPSRNDQNWELPRKDVEFWKERPIGSGYFVRGVQFHPAIVGNICLIPTFERAMHIGKVKEHMDMVTDMYQNATGVYDVFFYKPLSLTVGAINFN